MPLLLRVDEVIGRAIAFLEREDPDKIATMTTLELSDYINRWLIEYRQREAQRKK